MNDHIAYATGRLRDAASLPALMAAAFDGLELMERATTALTEDVPLPGYAAALTEASEAWWALSTAPSLSGPPRPGADDSLARRDLTEALARFSLTLAQSLVSATARAADPADRIACLQAARHIGRVHTALS